MRIVVEWTTKCCFWATYLIEWVKEGNRPQMNPQRAQRLGEFLRHRREELEMSARMLARLVNVRDSTIMRLERGAYAAPAADKLARIAEALKLELADVYALAEYVIPSSLPSFPHYLATRYPLLPQEAVTELHEHFSALIDLNTEAQPEGESI
jgi:transcriptional regulator with XRE-family HTH domain